jgi:hypothetical protein
MLTTPCGVPAPAAVAITVNVTESSRATVLLGNVSLIVVGAGFTVTASRLETGEEL